MRSLATLILAVSSTNKVKEDLIKALKNTITEFYGKEIQASPDFGRIVNQTHFDRLNDLLGVHKSEVGPI
jgi:aldehyde dehydrogenase (NAD+)